MADGSLYNPRQPVLQRIWSYFRPTTKAVVIHTDCPAIDSNDGHGSSEPLIGSTIYLGDKVNVNAWGGWATGSNRDSVKVRAR